MPSHDLSRNVALLIGLSIAVVGLGKLVLHSAHSHSHSRSRSRSPQHKIIPSPRTAVQSQLSKTQRAELPYPPDVFPGARDVGSPYGTLRVYEWGPETGKKVLFLHGISTPCLSLGGIANALVEKGCRVILMDLWGRGYSDCVADLPHDSRLYTTQILLAITSSPIPWTPEGFSVIGYSFGGGITVDFAVACGPLVKEVVLLAPCGLIRGHHFSLANRWLYSGWVPRAWLEHTVWRRLGGGGVKAQKSKEGSVESAVQEEVAGEGNQQEGEEDFDNVLLSKNRPGVTVKAAVSWQLENHEGFVRSFVSGIQNASIQGMGETWRKLREREGKVLIIVGRADSVIVPRELREDAEFWVGREKMIWKELDGGHEFPIRRAEEVADVICEAWGI